MRAALEHVAGSRALFLSDQEIVNKFADVTSTNVIGVYQGEEVAPIADGRIMRYDAITGDPLAADSGRGLPLSAATLKQLRKELRIDDELKALREAVTTLHEDRLRWANELGERVDRILKTVEGLATPSPRAADEAKYHHSLARDFVHRAAWADKRVTLIEDRDEDIRLTFTNGKRVRVFFREEPA